MIYSILNNQKETIRYMVVIALISTLCILIYYFEIIIKIHTIYYHLFYFPVILSCYWWKKKGLIIPLFLSGILIIFSFYGDGTRDVIIEAIMRIVIILIIGISVSILSQNVLKSEQNLRESEEKYRYFFNNAQVGLFWSSISDGKFIECNDIFAKLVGYDTREECLADYITLEQYLDLNARDEMLEEILIKNEIKDFEIQVTKKDGTPYWASISARAELKENRIEGAATNITNRKKAEMELQLERDNLINILSSMKDGVYIVDQNYNIEYVNPVLTKEFGSSEGKKCHEYLYGCQDVCTWCKNQEVFKGKTVRWELNSIKNQKIYDNIDTPLRNFDGTISKLKIIRDITSLKKSEQDLRESEVKYRHLFETSPYFIGLLNSEGNLIDCNDAINDILSTHTKENVLDKNFKEIFLLNEKNTNHIPIFEKVIKSIFEGVNQEGFDFRLYRSIGDYLWIHIEFSLIEIENQELIQFIMQDITERKRSEQLLQESMEDLARINAELEQFTFVTSHDLKEPLRMISSFIQLLEKRYKDKLDEDANDFIAFVVDGAKRMQELIDSLLEYSKIGRYHKEFEDIDLDDVLKDVLDNLKQLIKETNAKITYDPLPTLIGNEVELIQLLQNLISNAIKFHKKEEPPVVQISAKLHKNQWIFSVSDNGIGIHPKDFERVFIIFQRLQAKNEFGGTGIGLAICKKIVERHKGKIWVESEVGKGSTFYFLIPKEIRIEN